MEDAYFSTVETGIPGYRFQGLVPLKAGLRPCRPPLGRILRDSVFKKAQEIGGGA
ncbi:MAG: hypothetical protein ACTSXK_12140 [Promethearchaeota archaeon]